MKTSDIETLGACFLEEVIRTSDTKDEMIKKIKEGVKSLKIRKKAAKYFDEVYRGKILKYSDENYIGYFFIESIEYDESWGSIEMHGPRFDFPKKYDPLFNPPREDNFYLGRGASIEFLQNAPVVTFDEAAKCLKEHGEEKYIEAFSKWRFLNND